MTFEDSPLDPGADPRQRLGWVLRLLREAHGESQPVLADALGVSFQVVSHWEHTGKIKLSICRQLDTRWDTAGFLERFWYEAREDQKRDFTEVSRQERTASRLRVFGAMWVPGLVQTSEYTRAAALSVGEPDLERVIAQRRERQEILVRESPPRLWIMLDQGVLDRPIGGADVMRHQIKHLVDVGERGHVTLRIVTRSIGGYRGLDGSFQLMSADGRSTAYVPAPGGGFMIQRGEDVEDFLDRWDAIGERALTWDDSKEIMIKAMEGLA